MRNETGCVSFSSMLLFHVRAGVREMRRSQTSGGVTAPYLVSLLAKAVAALHGTVLPIVLMSLLRGQGEGGRTAS